MARFLRLVVALLFCIIFCTAEVESAAFNPALRLKVDGPAKLETKLIELEPIFPIHPDDFPQPELEEEPEIIIELEPIWPLPPSPPEQGVPEIETILPQLPAVPELESC